MKRSNCSDRASCRSTKHVLRWWLAQGAATTLFSLLPLLSYAQKEKASLISIGYTSLLDTYISQETATGTELRYTWEKANRKSSAIGLRSSEDGYCSSDSLPSLRHWSSFVSQDAFISWAGTRGNDNSFLGAMYNLRFGWHYNFDITTDLNVRLGGLADVALGGLYNTRNSNNPAQARASMNIDPSLLAVWHFKVKNKPFAMRYEASMPLLGIAFSPNYGQSYYEIFTRGNYDHNVVFLSPFSAVQFHQMFTLDFRLWHTTFTVGYLGDIRQMDANNLKYHQYSHNIVIGWRY